MTWCVLIFPSRKRWMSLSIDYLLEGSDEHLTVRQWLPQGYQSECINTPTIVIAYTVYSISIIVYQFLDNSNESVFSEDMPCQLSPKVVKTIGTKFFPSDLVCFHQRPHIWMLHPTRTWPWRYMKLLQASILQDIKPSHQKKSTYFPWNTGCLIGILAMCLLWSPHNWIVSHPLILSNIS